MTFVQRSAVDVDGMFRQLFDGDRLGALEKDLHVSQLPVGNAGFIFRHGGQEEHGHLFAVCPDDVLVIAGKAGRGLGISQFAVTDDVFHIGCVSIPAFIDGVFGAGQIINRCPVRVFKKLGEDFGAFFLRLGGLVLGQPVLQRIQQGENTHDRGDHQDKIDHIENDGAQLGLFKFQHGYSSLSAGRTMKKVGICRGLDCRRAGLLMVTT